MSKKHWSQRSMTELRAKKSPPADEAHPWLAEKPKMTYTVDNVPGSIPSDPGTGLGKVDANSLPVVDDYIGSADTYTGPVDSYKGSSGSSANHEAGPVRQEGAFKYALPSLWDHGWHTGPTTYTQRDYPGGGPRVLDEGPANEYLRELTQVRTAGGHYYSGDPELAAFLADQDRRLFFNLSRSERRRQEIARVMATLHGMMSFWQSPDGKETTVTVAYRDLLSSRHQYYDVIQTVEHAPRQEPGDDLPLKQKKKPGRKPEEGRTVALTSKEKNDRYKAKKAAKLHVVEDHNTFYRCEACTMYHRADFVPGRDVRFEDGKWIEPRDQWVWGELPEGATLRSEA
jgi:hypothetical protein